MKERNNNFVVGFSKTTASPLAGAVPGTYGSILFAGVNGNPDACCNPSSRKLAPRFGFAYSVDTKTTIRGGFGIFYAPTRYTADATFAPGFTQTTTYVASNDGNYTPAATLSNPFSAGIIKPAGSSGGGLTGVGSSFNYLDQARGSGIVDQFSIDVQRELPGHVALQVGYVRGRVRATCSLPPPPTA